MESKIVARKDLTPAPGAGAVDGAGAAAGVDGGGA